MDRRGFLRGVTCGLAGVGLAGCDVGRRSAPGDADPSIAGWEEPTLRPWADDILWIDGVPASSIVAYVSMAERRIFVDYEYRDRTMWLLEAHISVSTGLWRIPLPGDPPREPVSPGDDAREFEESDLAAWDPSGPPAMDDIRIRPGISLPTTLELSCLPASPEVGGAVRGGPWSIDRGVAAPEALTGSTVREDFGLVGMALHHVDRRCAGSGRAVQLVAWRATAQADPV